jgi:hypothetical protein
MLVPFPAHVWQFSDQTILLYLLKAKSSKPFRVKGFCYRRRTGAPAVGVRVSVKLNSFRGMCSSF